MTDRALCPRGCTHRDGTLRLVEPGLQVCGSDETRLRTGLRDVGTLYALLADPRRGQEPRNGGASAEHAQALSDDARRVRSDLRLALVQWCKILAEPPFNITLPDERYIRGTTIRLLQAADAAGQLASLGDRHDDAKRARATAADLRDQLATDADIQQGLAEHIARQLTRLLADPEQAVEFAEHWLFLLGEAQRLAYRGRRRTIACACGARVAVDPDRLMVCPSCGQDGDIAWWQEQALAEQDGRPLRLRELPDWLLLRGVQVSYEQIRSWADDGALEPALVDGPTPEQPTAPRRYDGRTVQLIADHRLRARRAAATRS